MNKFNFYLKFWEQPKRILQSYRDRILRWDNAKLIERKVNRHRNELVISVWDDEISLLLGWIDKPDDYYYVMYKNNDLVLSSCVGSLTALKGKINNFDYYQMEHIWFLNNPSISELLEEVKARDMILL